MKDGLTELQQKVDTAVQATLKFSLKLPEPDRSKVLTCLAYEYFNLDMEEKAFKILEKADPEYFKTHMKKDLEDPQMKQIFFSIIGKLIDAGYVKVEENGGQEG